MKDQFIEHFKTLSLCEQAEIINELTDLRSAHFHELYWVVEVYNGNANISHHISKATGFQCYHVPGSLSGTIGTNKVLVPRELYTKELGQLLTAYWDTWHPKYSTKVWGEVLENFLKA